MTEVAIGTAVVAYIEPHAGQARAFNRWYERDHFYAATTGRARGVRRARAGSRPARARRCGRDRDAGSAIRRAGRSSRRLAARRRASGVGRVGRAADGDAATPARSHVRRPRSPPHRGVPVLRAEARADDGATSAATALDHGFAGRDRDRGATGATAVEACAARSSDPSCRWSSVFDARARDPHDAGRSATARRSCSASRPAIRCDAWRARVEPRRSRPIPARRLREPVPPYDPRHRRVRRRPVSVGRREPQAVHPRVHRHHRAQPRALHAPHDRELVPDRERGTQHELLRRVGAPSGRPARGRRS